MRELVKEEELRISVVKRMEEKRAGLRRGERRAACEYSSRGGGKATELLTARSLIAQV